MNANASSIWRLARFDNGYNFSSDGFSDFGTPVVRIKQLVDQEAKFDYFHGAIPRRHRIDSGDLIFSWSATLAVRLWDRGPAFLNQHLFKVVPGVGVEKNWLRWTLESAIPYFEGQMHGSAMTHLNIDMLRKVRVPWPSIEEQQSIAGFLNAETARIDKLIAARRRQQRLLESRLLGEWGSLVEWAGNRYGWVPIRRFIQSITDGPFGSSLTSNHYVDHGARVIRLGNIGRARFKSTDEAFISREYYSELRRHSVAPGDVIVAGLGDENNPLARACVAPDNLGLAIVKADCFRLRLDQTRVDHPFLAWILSSPVVADQVALLARGSTRARINLGVVREIKIPVPPLSEQAKIVASLEQARNEQMSVSERFDRQLALLAERRQALITAAVTGQINVTTARG